MSGESEIIREARGLVALTGLPGAGKSSAAAALMARYPFHLLDRDRIRLELSGRVSGDYETQKVAAGRVLRDAIVTLLQQDRLVLVDGMTLARWSQRQQLRDAAHAAGAPCLLLWIDTPAAAARQRVFTQRDHPAPDRDSSLVDAVAARFEMPRLAARIDGLQPEAVMQAAVLANVAEWLRRTVPADHSGPRP